MVVPKAAIYQTQTFFAKGKMKEIKQLVANIRGESLSFWQDGDMEWKDAEDSPCIPLHPWLQYHSSGVLTHGKSCAFIVCIDFEVLWGTHKYTDHLYKWWSS